jgi:PTH1 family peptidyl-tRNA hydrolase
MDALGTGAFPRVRLGVSGPGRAERDLADYVLEPFGEDEREIARALVTLGADAVDAVLDSGVESAMNRFNGRVAAPVQQSEEG